MRELISLPPEKAGVKQNDRAKHHSGYLPSEHYRSVFDYGRILNENPYQRLCEDEHRRRFLKRQSTEEERAEPQQPIKLFLLSRAVKEDEYGKEKSRRCYSTMFHCIKTAPPSL